MKIENSETERTGNLEVLAGIEGEITRLEQMREQLSSLEGERDRLNTAVQNLHFEEAQILKETTNEAAIIKRLTTTRSARDVQSARLVSTKDKIEACAVELAEQGAVVRKAFAAVVTQLWTARQQRVMTMLSETFGSPFIRLRIGRVELRELLDQTALMKQLKDSRNRFTAPISDTVQEELALRRTRTWLQELKDLIESEPNLTLRSVKPPIEQRQPAMATA
jgi:hypothetical protein